MLPKLLQLRKAAPDRPSKQKEFHTIAGAQLPSAADGLGAPFPACLSDEQDARTSQVSSRQPRSPLASRARHMTCLPLGGEDGSSPIELAAAAAAAAWAASSTSTSTSAPATPSSSSRGKVCPTPRQFTSELQAASTASSLGEVLEQPPPSTTTTLLPDFDSVEALQALLPERLRLHLVLPQACRGPKARHVQLQVPEDTEAIVIVSSFTWQAEAVNMAKVLVDRYVLLPVMVMLNDDCTSDEDASELLQASRAFQAVGVEDVFLRPDGDIRRMQLEVTLRTVQALQRRHRSVMVQQEVKALQGHRRGSLGSAATPPAQQQEHSDHLFWSCVHRAFKGFPKVDAGASGLMGPGERVGPCTLGTKLGQGAHGVVYAARNGEANREEAVKVIAKRAVQDVRQAEAIWREFKLLQQLEHPNIVRFYGVVHAEQHICIRMENAGADLKQAIQAEDRLSGRRVCALGAQIAAAVAFCHQAAIAHRDVKPENVGLSGRGASTAKLLDFGTAVEVAQSCAREPRGTMPYTAPEVLRLFHAGPSADYDPRPADVWSLGVTLLETAYGIGRFHDIVRWPANVDHGPSRGEELAAFFGGDRGALAEAVASLGPLRASSRGDASAVAAAASSLSDLLAGTFVVDARVRWTAEEVGEWLSLRTSLGQSGAGR